MRKPLVIEMVNAATGKVEWSGCWRDFQEANYDDPAALDAAAGIVSAYRQNKPFLPLFEVDGGDGTLWHVRGLK